MARKIKTIEEALKLTGLDLGRYVKWLTKELDKLLGYEKAGKLTDPRKKKLTEINSQLGKLKSGTKSKSKAEGVPKKEKGKDYTPTPAQAKRIKEYKEMAAKTSGRKLTPKQTEARKNREAKKQLKRDIQQSLGGSGGARQRDLTPEGQKLWDENTEASMKKLAKGLKRYSYPGGRQAPKSKIEGDIPKRDMPLHERIEAALGRDVHLTRQQVQDMMGGKLTKSELEDTIQDQAGERVSKADMEKAFEAAGFQVKSSGFNKGGYKKFQGRSKLGSKEHVYAGGGSVSDISHFRKKKK